LGALFQDLELLNTSRAARHLLSYFKKGKGGRHNSLARRALLQPGEALPGARTK
jgi:hypothetical protein